MSENSNEYIESLMKLMPSGIPYNDDTWMKLRSWIKTNIHIAEEWNIAPPTPDEEEHIYNIFGCNSPLTNGYLK